MSLNINGTLLFVVIILVACDDKIGKAAGNVVNAYKATIEQCKEGE